MPRSTIAWIESEGAAGVLVGKLVDWDQTEILMQGNFPSVRNGPHERHGCRWHDITIFGGRTADYRNCLSTPWWTRSPLTRFPSLKDNAHHDHDLRRITDRTPRSPLHLVPGADEEAPRRWKTVSPLHMPEMCLPAHNAAEPQACSSKAINSFSICCYAISSTGGHPSYFLHEEQSGTSPPSWAHDPFINSPAHNASPCSYWSASLRVSWPRQDL